ncbi:hypothetical protein GCM10022206_66090 [Streptomyces chiangmaiensis]
MCPGADMRPSRADVLFARGKAPIGRAGIGGQRREGPDAWCPSGDAKATVTECPCSRAPEGAATEAVCPDVWARAGGGAAERRAGYVDRVRCAGWAAASKISAPGAG